MPDFFVLGELLVKNELFGGFSDFFDKYVSAVLEFNQGESVAKGKQVVTWIFRCSI